MTLKLEATVVPVSDVNRAKTPTRRRFRVELSDVLQEGDGIHERSA
jgi:hypothetical protein